MGPPRRDRGAAAAGGGSLSDLLDTIDRATISAAGPEYREWMNPSVWCGWCGYIHVICKCGDAG